MQNKTKPTLLLLLIGLIALLVLGSWQVNFASANGDPDATRPAGNQIITRLILNLTCESGSLTVINLSDEAGEEAIRLIVLGEYFLFTVPLEANETVVIPLDYAELGITFPLTGTINIGAQSNDMKVIATLGPCDGSQPTPTNTPTNTPVPTATNTPAPSTTPTNTPIPPTPTNTPVPPTPTNTPIPPTPTPTVPAEPCLKLTKTLDGPFRTSDDLFLSDGIIPVAVQGENNGNEENLFYFLVTIEVENCGGTELTNVVVEDTFSNEAQPFETDDPGNVTMVPVSDPFDGMVKESLTWDAGSIAVGDTVALNILVGTEFNSSGLLEPTSFGQTIFYNGQDNGTGSASVTADGGLSAEVDAMELSIGDEISCIGSEGQWDSLVFVSGPNVGNHDKCAEVVTDLPILFTATVP